MKKMLLLIVRAIAAAIVLFYFALCRGRAVLS